MPANAPAPPSLRALRVLVRGAGEMASGVGMRLARCGFQVLMTEIAQPLAVRRAVSFCEAVYDGAKTVEGLTARLVASQDEAAALWARGELPVLVDPDLTCLPAFQPAVLADATLAKRNIGISRGMAPLTFGLGPGFSAGDDVHLVVETKRGHHLGRLITRGPAAPDTGVPGVIAGYGAERVLRAPADGELTALLRLGEMATPGQVVGAVGGREVVTAIGGMLRGLLRPGIPVTAGMKIGDVDPRGEPEYLTTISEKARAIAGGVLEGILSAFNR